MQTKKTNKQGPRDRMAAHRPQQAARPAAKQGRPLKNEGATRRPVPRTIRCLTKYHGGKGRLAPWIVPQIPAGRIYIEPFGGAASILLRRPPSPIEVYNDLEPGIADLMLLARDHAAKLVARLSAIEFYDRRSGERAFEFYKTMRDDKAAFATLSNIDRAVATYVVLRMSRSGMGTAFAWSERKRGGEPGDLHSWKTGLENVWAVSARLQGVEILNTTAIEVLDRYSSPKSTAYCDPPYPHRTRVSRDAYSCEMSTADHVALAKALHRFKGKVVLSGRPCKLYDRRLYSDWRRIEKTVANNSSQAKSKPRTREVLWMNF